jgi:CHAT domain-containing protein
MDNIGKIYLDLGDFTKALDVYTYAYQSKLRLFEKDNFEIAKAKVFLATVYNDKHQYHAAKQYAADALRILKLKGDTANSWDAGANTQLAYACRYLKQTHLATLYYEEAYRLNKIASGEKYNEFFFGFIEGLAIFYGENNQSQKAIALAKNALMKAIQSQGEQSPVAIRQMQTLSKAYLIAKDFSQAEKQALKATLLADQLLSKAQNTTDSISLEIVKAKLILTEAKAQYYQLSKPDTVVVKRILQQLEQAVGIMEHRMTIFSDQTDINLLIANNKDLTDFIKQLQYTLFELSSNKEYIKQLINLHEATLYTKIRSRLNKQNALQFLNLPDSVRQMEDKLKANLQLTSNAKAVQQTSTNYLQAIHQWNAFIESLKAHYPKYYQLRYAPFDFSLDELHHHIPNDVTVLRYVMVENKLFVLVLSQKQPPIMLPLSSKDLKEKIIALNDRNTKPQQVCSLSNSLYRQLWQPIEKYIQYKRIVIVPDGILFNVSFDMLATKQVTTYADLAKHTLLQQYPISYQYSLAAMQFESTVTKMKSNYIAFAPVFSSEDKLSYKRSMQQDSLHLDKTYLNLLPLPFTLNLVEKVKSMLGGKLYTNKEATTSSFKTQAAHHHIIHLGTHAESNNDYPEYSRLLFAKEPSQISDDNSLYLYDIYNCDITSDLTVLAACESGKPGYQDGEGMISLAHAFKYAGSQAIMTALWRIDEQSSTQIIEQFYKNLKKGMSKDVALQQAKITYLQQASGRSLSPAYWGGLVILGDPNAIELNDAYDFSYWIEAIIFLAAIFLTWFIISRKSSSSTV